MNGEIGLITSQCSFKFMFKFKKSSFLRLYSANLTPAYLQTTQHMREQQDVYMITELTRQFSM